MPKTRRLSDATLVRRSQQGDRRAFGALVNRYDDRLRGLAFALLLDGAQMDAALSMAYLRAWRDVVRVQPRDDVGPWLYRAVYNACIDQLRRGEPPRADGDTDGLYGALARLAPADRVAVVLVEREGFTPASAARILGVGSDVIETRLDLAREHLRPFVPEPAPPAPDDAADDEAAAAGAGDRDAVAATIGAGAGDPAAQEGSAASEPEDAPEPVPAAGAVSPDAGAEPDTAADAGADTSADTAAADGPSDEPAPRERAPAEDAGGTPDAAVAARDDAAEVAGADEPTADRSTMPVDDPPEPDVEGVRVLEPVGAANDPGNGEARTSGNGGADDTGTGEARTSGNGELRTSGNGGADDTGNGEAPPLPDGDAHIEHTPADLSEEIVIAEEDAAAARRSAAGVHQAR